MGPLATIFRSDADRPSASFTATRALLVFMAISYCSFQQKKYSSIENGRNELISGFETGCSADNTVVWRRQKLLTQCLIL